MAINTTVSLDINQSGLNLASPFFQMAESDISLRRRYVQNPANENLFGSAS